MARLTDFINAVSSQTGNTYRYLSEARVDYFTSSLGYTDGSRGGVLDEVQAIKGAIGGSSDRLSDTWIEFGASNGSSDSGTKRYTQIRDEMITPKNF